MTERRARKLKAKKGKKIYAWRTAIAEPVFGRIHTRQGKHVLLRRLAKAAHEPELLADCHNLLKLHTYRTSQTV